MLARHRHARTAPPTRTCVALVAAAFAVAAAGCSAGQPDSARNDTAGPASSPSAVSASISGDCQPGLDEITEILDRHPAGPDTMDDSTLDQLRDAVEVAYRSCSPREMAHIEFNVIADWLAGTYQPTSRLRGTAAE